MIVFRNILANPDSLWEAVLLAIVIVIAIITVLYVYFCAITGDTDSDPLRDIGTIHSRPEYIIVDGVEYQRVCE